MRSGKLAFNAVAGAVMLCVAIPLTSQVSITRPPERVLDRAQLPPPNAKTLPRPDAEVRNHTVRLKEFPMADISLWAPGPGPSQAFFISRGKDLGAEAIGYRSRAPIWHLRQRTSDNNSITIHLRREASTEPCPPRVELTLNNDVIGRNGYKFNVGQTTQSSGAFEQRAGGYNVINYNLVQGDNGRFERLHQFFQVIKTRPPGQTSITAQEQWICHAILNFDVFVNGPVNVDPLAPPKMVAGSALSTMKPAKGPASELERNLVRIRAQPVRKLPKQ